MTPPELKVGGRLEFFTDSWEHHGASIWQLKTVKRGLTWTFKTPPPLSPQPIFYHQKCQMKQKLLEDCITSMWNKGAIEEVPNPHTPGFYSTIFLREKKSGEMRPIINLSQLNSHILTPTFKMESSQSIRMNLSKGQWVASVDLEDAYFHIPIR